ncbi:MAG: tRNA (adenosine(37)-N6)-threonylcarbamoyltransferase complex ATPase subunit type 1 TsaE [Burkholderiales bacterium]|uniref:tRNA (adenosine(37)-N6)-threonylcarbamoyltransferase complex ATPase subunit type 1 TsaE n=1 Tax=Inhella sp. TaxID=1921806 RepID=UPI001AC446BD|nr:tRNA (adenosine(37)-N6)-threonylcarbamoyltransferase complex ATPase subunit type 1 TsaE [Burkholderiales bacterium]
MAEILETKHLHWPDEAATQAAAEGLVPNAPLAGALITLEGGLGAGKTTFVRHLLRRLGAEGRIKSPSYAVMESYELPTLKALHFDFYRLSDPREAEDAGFRELLAGPALKLCEWPGHAGPLLERADLRLLLEADEHEGRHVTAEALSVRGSALLHFLK